MTDAVFLDLSRYDRFAVDTETTGVGRADRPVGCSIWTPDGVGRYMRWGHERGGNNCTLEEFVGWARAELARPGQVKVFFNAPFDLRMLAYVGAIEFPGLIPNVEDAGTSAALLNENEPSYSLDRLGERYLGERKEDAELLEYCAAQFGGRPWRTVQGRNIWRAPGDLVEAYAVQDAGMTLRLHDRNRAALRAEGLEPIYRTETDLIPILVNMHLAGVRVDRARAEEVNRGLLLELDRAKRRWMELADAARVDMPPQGEWALPSTAQAAAVFRATGVPAIGKTEVRKNDSGDETGGNDSVTKELLEAAADEHEPARCLLRIRELTKLGGTFIKSYILDEADEHDRVHGEFHPLPVEYLPGKRYGTVSGRLASSLHNVPGDRHPTAGRLVRGLFIPYDDEGEWVKADYSQIEYRFLGHYAGGSIAAAYNRDPDVDFHQMLADLIDRPDICNRRRTKNVNFAKVYGAGLAQAARTAGITVPEWKKILAVYDERVPEVDQIYKAADRRANQRGYIVTWGGRRCRFMTAAEARSKGWRVRDGEAHVSTYKALNRLLQGSAADLIKKAMVRVAGPGGLVDWRNTVLHLTVHDELDFTSRRGAEGERFRARLAEAMEDWRGEGATTPLTVPIKADINAGASWGALIKD